MSEPYGSFAYVQARLAARHSRRADEGVWRRLRTSRDLRHCLHIARATGLGHWLTHVPAAPDADAIDLALRHAFRDDVSTVSQWVPEAWSEAVGRIATLVDVNTVAATADPQPPWVDGWRDTWPRMSGAQRRTLDALVELVATHARAMQQAAPETDGWTLRSELAGGLRSAYRRHAGGPGAVFAFLGLNALDVERIRGALVRRALFPTTRSASQWV